MEINQEVACPSCGNIITGTYCSTCGEKRIAKHDFSLKHFLEEGVEGVTHFDNKFFRSVKILFTRPGLLTSFYTEGKRVLFMKPFQLFIVCNLMFFIFSGKFNFFSKQLHEYNTYAPYTNFNTKAVIREKAKSEAGFTLLATAFNERIAAESKAFVLLFIPVLTLSSLLFFRERKFSGEHLAFTTHFFSFILLYEILFSYLIGKPFYAITESDYNAGFDQLTAIINLLVFIVYYIIAVRRFFNASWLLAISGAILTGTLFVISVFGYRILLFYKIIYSLHL